MKIEPDVDKYGSLARGSFFADYLELLALHGDRARLESLRDLIGENFSRKKEILFNPARDEDSPEWEVTDLADEAWTCLLQRSQLLGDLYPFAVTRKSLKLKPGTAIDESPYVGMLAVTLAHAFDSTGSNVVENLFEDLVADAMENAGLSVARVGPISRAEGFDFMATLTQVGVDLGAPVTPNAIVRRVNANDEKVDIVGHFDWNLARKGRWYFLCQATCGKSDGWRGKAQEPVADDWKELLGEVTPPIPFLAVPHHADDLAMKYVTATRVNVLDRPRLVRNLASVSTELKAVINSVIGADYQSFKV